MGTRSRGGVRCAVVGTFIGCLSGCSGAGGSPDDGAVSIDAVQELADASNHVQVCQVLRAGDCERTVIVNAKKAQKLLTQTPSYAGPCFDYGDSATLGNGSLRTFTQFSSGGGVLAQGLTFSAAMLDGLPTELNDGRHCFDVNGDATIDNATECADGHERILYMPERVLENPLLPLTWMMTNWNPMGHPPPGIYDQPHFDFHIYILDETSVNTMVPGPCPGLIDCDARAIAAKDVPEKYTPQGYANIGAVEVAMGNHLVDLSAHEFTEPGSFDATWLYGSWNGSIAFYEPMITRAYLLSKPDTCTDLKLPAAWERAGYYPTKYCVRYRANRGDYTVSVENFVYRTAE